ncbi:MAG: exodeoxyribonuclease VII small subunit [Deltaproteobacteria bacterium]|nr:exodeoxyribonuclease VII small subunit [Deltaproteobacteria bacterium]
MENKPSEISFETSLKELEKIVAELEKGELALESQLKSFERGVALSRECLKKLEEIEKRVETLVQQPDGKLTPVPFEPNGRPESA